MKTVKQLRESKSENSSKFPFMLVLKRKSIRAFPGGQLVALYHSDQLNQDISVPFATLGDK